MIGKYNISPFVGMKFWYLLIEGDEISVGSELSTDECYLKEENRSHICTELFLSVSGYWCNTQHQN